MKLAGALCDCQQRGGDRELACEEVYGGVSVWRPLARETAGFTAL